MEDGFKKLLERHRDRFRRAVTVERLFSPLVARHVLTSDEIQALQNESPIERLDSLIDILTEKNYEAFKRFCIVLETTYPYMLNCMFLGVEPPSLTGFTHGKSDGQLSDKTADLQERRLQCVVSVGRSVSMTGRDLYKDRMSLLNKELKIVTRDLEHVKQQLQKAENERDNAYHDLAEFAGHKNVEWIEDENSSSINSTNLSCDYIKLKNQYVNAVKDLEITRHQNTELTQKCDSATKEADYFRKKHKTGLNNCDILVREAQSLQQQLEEVQRDRDLVRQEYEEIVLLREREKIELHEIRERHSNKRDACYSSEVVDKYEVLQKDHEELRETNRVLRGENNHRFNQLESLETDYSSLKDQYESLLQKHEELLVDNSSLKQQYGTAKRNYEKTLKELDSAVKMSQQAHSQKDAAMKERDHAISIQMKKVKEVSKLTEERNAVFREYQLVMSERDVVHKEIEKLQEEISNGKAQNKTLLVEKERLVHESDSLHRELNEHDKLLKENFILKEKLNHVLVEKEQISKERDIAKEDYEMFQQERDAARKERSEAIIHRDKILKECFEIKQRHQYFVHGENHEAEALRRKFEVLSSELSTALHEVEVAKSQRDWAFSERDKIVRERDSMRATCDKLRQERDSAVSDLAELLRDSDQKSRAHMEELSELRSRIEKLLKEDIKRELVASRDSAIDTDSTEWETETVSLERPNHEEDLGIAIAGGCDAPHLPNDSSIVITNVAKGSVADGKLRVNDCVLKVNNIDLTNVEHNIAVQAINHAEILNLLVKRKRSASTKSLVQPVQLVLSEGKELGIQIDVNKCISFISPGSIAAEATLDVGDKIITINGKSVEDLSQMEAEKLLSTSMVTLAILKQCKTASSTHVLQSVLEEVSEKIARDIDNCQKMEHRLKGNSDINGCLSQKRTPLYNSKRRPPTHDGHMSSSTESSSEHALNMSLTPLYEEKSQGTPPDSSDNSIGHSSELLDSFHLSSQFQTTLSGINEMMDRSQQLSQPHSLHFSSSHLGQHKGRPPPPMRTCSYLSAVTCSTNTTKTFQDTESESQEDSVGIETVHYPSSSLPDSSVVEESKVVSRSKVQRSSRQLRPQSAPSSRHKKDASKSYYQGRYSTNLDTNLYSSSQLQPSSPPASMAVLKSRHVPYYTAKSVTLPTNSFLAESQQCTAVQCWNSKHISQSHSGLSSSSDHYSSITRQSRQGSTSSVGSSHRSHGSHSRYKMIPKVSKVSRKGKRLSLPVSSNCQSSSMSSLSSGQTTPRVETLHFDLSAEEKELDARRDYEPRIIQIEKKDSLGISIAQGTHGGVFICLVTPSSVAFKSGLRYGDQILEYNGVNLRCATYEQAAKILKESGSSVTILAQYSPQKFLDAQLTAGSSPSEASSAVSTPVTTKRRLSNCKPADNTVALPLPEKIPLGSNMQQPGELRAVAFKKKSQSLGVSIVGGNSTGIFVSEIEPTSPATGKSGLCVGDQILKFNGTDLTSSTLEEATLELCKPTDTVDLIAQYNPGKFKAALEQPGDSFYVRALFDRPTHCKEELSFKKGNILFITDTMHNGHVGCWKACLVSEEDAQKRENGIIPSRMKAEQEILLRHSISHTHGDEKFVGRRSLFRRSKKGVHGMTINHSRDSSDSATSMTASCSDLIMASYQIVEKLDNHTPRAVIVFAPMVEVIYEKLCQESPYKFFHCKPELINITADELEHVLADGTLVDHSWKGSQLTCTTLASITNVTDKHCLLNLGLKAVERLHALQVYPIIVFVKFKNAKHLRQKTQTFNLKSLASDQDAKDHFKSTFSSKDAKDFFEQSLKVEKEYKQLFNAVISGGNLKDICSQIQDAVVEQQKKAVWVPLPSI